MKRFYVFFVAIVPFLLCSCEEEGWQKYTTEDGITMQVYYVLPLNDRNDEAHVQVYAPFSGTIDSTSIYIDGYFIQEIDTIPWQYVYNIGMLNAGDHVFWLIHTAKGHTDTLKFNFFINDSRGILNIFNPSN